jgi:phosphate:Na+ symporter
MSFREAFLLVFMLLGGLAIFILGMNMMTEGLRKAVGANLQRLLAKTTRNRFAGLGLGTALGTTIHSGPTVVMLLGFVNAGLMTLEQSIAPILGANIGTTLSMQAVSFKINDYCFVAITAGLLISLATRSPKGKDLGRAFLGFGLLFLGMNLMKDAITPVKETLAFYFQSVNGDTLIGTLIGVAISAVLTAVWQSSGATVAIVFALISAGVFKDFSQVFPIVIGSHIGTCITALLSSMGTNIEARRTAIAHLLFNIFNVAVAILLKPFFFYIITSTSSDLTHQAANLHTAVMIVGAALILPFTMPFAKFVRFVTSSSKPLPESSHLDYDLMEYPERSIVAVISELQRVSKICSSSLKLTAKVILHRFDSTTVNQIKMNEQVIDDIKIAIREYLMSMTKKYLSRRQIIMTHYLNRCMIDVERIGDHIDQLCELSLKRPGVLLDKELFDRLFELIEITDNVLSLVTNSMRPEQDNFQSAAEEILEMVKSYRESSTNIKNNFLRKVESHEITSIAALYFKEYVSILDRMIRHVENIALFEKNEDFWIKQSKLNKKPKELCENGICSEIDPDDYLGKLNT